MAGRPIALTIRESRDGTASVRAPALDGAQSRPTLRFPSRKVAERYRAAALAAWQANAPMPDPAPYQSMSDRRTTTRVADGFAEVAWAWWNKNYPPHYPNPERRAAVESNIKNHMIPYFGPRVDHVREITRLDCEEFVDFMAGDRPSAPPIRDDLSREYTLTEVAELTKRNRSTLQRAWQNGKFPHARRASRGVHRGMVLIPLGDLVASRYAPIKNQRPKGFARGTVKELLAVLNNIFIFAQAHGRMRTNPVLGLKAKDPVLGSLPVRPRSSGEAYLLELDSCKKIASHLHIHHLLTFWIIRLVGLRIGETFGITLGSIAKDGDQMYLAIGGQAGKTYLVLDENLQVTTATYKKNVKSKSSKRVVPLARPLAELIDQYIEMFHHGDHDPSTPLIVSTSSTGQGKFRIGLERAQQAAGFGPDVIGFNPTPHTYRKFFSTDLDEITPRVRSIYLGHKVRAAGGADLTESIYTLHTPNLQRLLEAPRALECKIAEKIGSLVDPMPDAVIAPRELFTSEEQHREVLDLLEANGFLAPTTVGDEEVLRIREAAELLAISEVRVKRLMGKGVLEARQIQGPGSRQFGGVTLESAMARLEADQMLWTRKRICEEFDLGPVELQRLVDKLNLKSAEVGPVKGLRYRDEEVERLRRHFETKRAAAANAVPVSGVVREIGCSKRTAQLLVASGQLQVDAEATRALGMTMVSRQSLDELIKARAARPTPPVSRPPGTIPIEEAQARTGLSRIEVLKLRERGLVIRRSSDYQFHVDEVSLREFAGEF